MPDDLVVADAVILRVSDVFRNELTSLLGFAFVTELLLVLAVPFELDLAVGLLYRTVEPEVPLLS